MIEMLIIYETTASYTIL